MSRPVSVDPQAGGVACSTTSIHSGLGTIQSSCFFVRSRSTFNSSCRARRVSPTEFLPCTDVPCSPAHLLIQLLDQEAGAPIESEYRVGQFLYRTGLGSWRTLAVCASSRCSDARRRRQHRGPRPCCSQNNSCIRVENHRGFDVGLLG
jgi:hypothetical protein